MIDISTPLAEALVEYKAAVAATPFPGEAGWSDDFQKRQERLVKATNLLLKEAANGFTRTQA